LDGAIVQYLSVRRHSDPGTCRKHLAAYKVPRAVQFVADHPKTSTGKIMRGELKSLDL